MNQHLQVRICRFISFILYKHLFADDSIPLILRVEKIGGGEALAERLNSLQISSDVYNYRRYFKKKLETPVYLTSQLFRQWFSSSLFMALKYDKGFLTPSMQLVQAFTMASSS